MSLDPSSLPATLTSQRTLVGGDAVTTWSPPSGGTFQVAGPIGAAISLTSVRGPAGVPANSPAGEDIGITLPNTSTIAITGDQAIAEYTASDRSLSQDALAAGIATSEVHQMVATLPSSRFIGHPICVGRYFGNKVAYGHACALRQLEQSSGANDWYIGTYITSSGSSLCCGRMFFFQAYDQYGSGTTTARWDPTANTPDPNSNCITKTFSVTLGAITASQQVTICPGVIVPMNPPPPHGFGTTWVEGDGGAGACPGDVKTAPSTSLQFVPNGARGDGLTMHIALGWWSVGC
jgi:hypothetical protein